MKAAALQGLAYQDVNAALVEATTRGILREASAAMIPALGSAEARRAWSDAVMTLPDGERRGRRWRSLVDEQIRSHGWDAAAEVLTTELPAEAISRNTLEPIAEAGMATDPEKVAGFLSNLSSGHAAEAVPAFTARWAERDYNAAGQWGSTPLPALRHGAIRPWPGSWKKSPLPMPMPMPMPMPLRPRHGRLPSRTQP